LSVRWYRGLATHLRMSHDWSADDYRAAFGLNAQRPLQAPGVSEVQAARAKRRLRTDRRWQEGMRQGLAMARSGELNELGRRADATRGRALERRRRTEQQCQRIGERRAARFRAQRDRRAQALGYADAADLLRRRYLDDGASVSELATALGCAEITITTEMDRARHPTTPRARAARGGSARAGGQARRGARPTRSACP
jgi:hypothetical protein